MRPPLAVDDAHPVARHAVLPRDSVVIDNLQPRPAPVAGDRARPAAPSYQRVPGDEPVAPPAADKRDDGTLAVLVGA
jgi:hypothetical protein